MMIADGDPAPAWQAAARRDGHLVELLRSVPHLGKADAAARGAVHAGRRAPRRDEGSGHAGGRGRRRSPGRAATARPSTCSRARFSRAPSAESRAAAITAVQLIPESAWTRGDDRAAGQGHRGDGQGDRPPIAGRSRRRSTRFSWGRNSPPRCRRNARLAVRRDLRALGVQVVRIQSVPEQMIFDLNWFAVQAGKPVQIVLANPDAMPHNLVIGQPGSLQEIGTKGWHDAAADGSGRQGLRARHAARAAGHPAAQRRRNGRLNFTAPAKPGEYVYLCTFPGHWVRMYGVMLVVENLEAWEAKPTVPTDPITKKPFASQRVVTSVGRLASRPSRGKAARQPEST